MRGSPVRIFCNRVVESRMLLACSICPRSLPLPPHLRQKHFPRVRFSCLTHFHSTSPAEGPPSHVLPPRGRHESLQVLEAEIMGEVLGAKAPPSETDVLLALQACQSHAAFQMRTSLNVPSGVTATSTLLSLDECQSVQAVKQPSSPSPPYKHVSDLPIAGQLPNSTEKAPVPLKSTHTRNLGSLTDLAYKIVSHPDVFITIPILASFVSLQSLIRDPTPIPAVFYLYGNKPYTPPGSSKPRHPNPKQIKYAIPSDIASTALDIAIEAKNMPICLDIIDTSYCTPAFQRAKMFRKAGPAAIASCLAPVAIYTLADILSGHQDEIDHSLAVGYAFAGLSAYVFFTVSTGMVALMTANDQMVRVTWNIGTRLRYRWLREEERAALDKVAQAWGFTELNRRGFEEGDDWELLREVVNRKGMYLDNPTLMGGME